jgi:hypothetical protein
MRPKVPEAGLSMLFLIGLAGAAFAHVFIKH